MTNGLGGWFSSSKYYKKLHHQMRHFLTYGLKLADAIDRAINLSGYAFLFLIPFVVLFGGLVVILRYGFATGYPWLSEIFVWLNGLIFVLGSPYLLLHGQHVKIDIIYSHLSRKKQALLNLIGVFLFLFPTTWVIAIMTWGATVRSLKNWETSPTPGGLPILYLLKLSIPIFCLLIALQGISIALRSLQQWLYGDESSQSEHSSSPASMKKAKAS